MTDLQQQLNQANKTIEELREEISQLQESTHHLEQWQFVINQTLIDAGLLKKVKNEEHTE